MHGLDDEPDDENGLHDREAPDDFDVDDAPGSVDTLPCPYCGKAVYEQAEVCHHCHNYISREERQERKPRWLVIAVILCLLAVLVGWLFTKPFV